MQKNRLTFHQDPAKPSIVLLDGAMGTMLQRAGLPLGVRPESFNLHHPDQIEAIHRSYIEAGSRIIYTNTFGANAHKLRGTGLDPKAVIESAVKIARRAAGETVRVALDIGPIGEMLTPNGTLSFEDAYEIFREMVVCGEQAGADLVVFETMTDLLEVKAGILAAKEHTALPVFVTMTFESNGRTFEGTPIEAMVSVAEGMGCDAVGINCSLGPREIAPFIRRVTELTDLPVIVKANAGLPNLETGQYDLDPDSYAEDSMDAILAGVRYIGGCCGTDPDFIRKLNQIIQGIEAADILSAGRRKEHIIASSATRAVLRGGVHVTGERLNPTGKKRFQDALINGSYDYILKQALEQAAAGAAILDVNVGHPGVDEVRVLPAIVRQLQSVCDLPLQLDTTKPRAMEAALRIYNGKAIINSVNGKESSMKDILPLARKYGASVIALPLDDEGIPETAEGRLEIIGKIITRADELGIPRQDIILDALTMTISAQGDSALVTLKCMDLVREKYGLLTTLGVSNISFGAPNRPALNLAFLTLALDHGLDLALINPNQLAMMEMITARRVLLNQDPAMKNYIRFMAIHGDRDRTPAEAKASLPAGPGPQREAPRSEAAGAVDSIEERLALSIRQGIRTETGALCEELLQTMDANQVVEDILIPALDQVGKEFEGGIVFLPQLIAAAAAAQEAFEKIREKLAAEKKESTSRGSILLATVRGDIHDIGKNIVKVVLENYGFDIIDLGRDVPVEAVVQQVREKNIQLVGLSALMTTTLESMNETIQALRATCPDVKIMVGGAVLTRHYAVNTLKADHYARDATESVAIAKGIFGGWNE